jgi:membrane protein implicated in regulation of membrane protease activity
MTTVFLACFLLGLVLGVYSMLHGVERQRSTPPTLPPHEHPVIYDPAAEPSPVLNLQVAGAVATVFGLTGYLLGRVTALGPWPRAGIAALAAAGAGAGAAALIGKWAIPSAREEHVDERYLLQGQLAQVTTAIGADGEGEIAYEANGTHYHARARSWDGSSLAAGSDVVIERVEDGVAFVELWAAVEQRL